MITDIFARRYASLPVRSEYSVEDSRFFNQAVTMLGNPLWTGYQFEKVADATEAGLKSVHDVIALELGRQTLSDQWWWSEYTWNGNTTRTAHKYSYADMIRTFLIATPVNPRAGDVYVKERLSVVELAFRYRANQVSLANQLFPDELAKAQARDLAPTRGIRVPGSAADAVRSTNTFINESFKASVAELNERMRLAGYRRAKISVIIQ